MKVRVVLDRPRFGFRTVDVASRSDAWVPGLWAAPIPGARVVGVTANSRFAGTWFVDGVAVEDC